MPDLSKKVMLIIDWTYHKAPTTPDLLLESSTSFSAGDVSMDTSSSDKTIPELPKANSDDGAISRKASRII